MNYMNGCLLRNRSAEETNSVLQAMRKPFSPIDEEEEIGIHPFEKAVFGISACRDTAPAADNPRLLFSKESNITIALNGLIASIDGSETSAVPASANSAAGITNQEVLAAYLKQGSELFSLLTGGFILIINDERNSKTFILRDFFGKQPLYYSQTSDGIYWSSELRSLLSCPDLSLHEIDKKALNLFLQLTYIPAPHCIYANIKKLPPNHYLEIDHEDFSCTAHEVKNAATVQQTGISFDDAKVKTRNLIEKSILNNLYQPAEDVGAFLSGGVDSSIVSLLLARANKTPIYTFSIGFEKDSFDERDKSRVVAKMIGSRHNEYVITDRDIEENIDKVLLNFDEPYGDSSAIPSYCVAKKAAEYVKVVLTGDGGDEVFGGYNKYYMGRLNQRYTRFIPPSVHKRILNIVDKLLSTTSDNRGKRFKLRKLLNSVNYEGGYYYNIISLGFQNRELASLLKPEWREEELFSELGLITGSKSETLHEFRNIDRFISLEGDSLPKVNRTSGLVGLDCRSPFLSRDLWNFTNSLPAKYLISGWDKKYLLKKTFEDEFPRGFLDKPKKGFGIPVGDWLRTTLREELENYIEPDFLEEQDIFNSDDILPVVQQHISGSRDNTFRVWTFYCFQKWYKKKYLRE